MQKTIRRIHCWPLAKFFALFFVLFICSPSARAMQQSVGRAELASMATHVLSLKVTAQNPRWVEEPGSLGGRTIQTQVQGRVLQQWKGQLAAELSLNLPGGRIGAERVWQEDIPALSVGQSYALFLHEDAQGILRIVGGLQGVVQLNLDGQSDESSVAEPLAHFVQSLRSSVPQPINVKEQPQQPLFFATSGTDWSYQQNPVEELFTINLGSLDFLDSALLYQRYLAALNTWNQESNAFLWLHTAGNSDVTQFGGTDDDNNVTMGDSAGWGSDLASARYRSSGAQMLDCDIKIYSSNWLGSNVINWSVAAEGAADGEQDLQHTLTHEMGHCLGLSHSEFEAAVMYATVGSGTGEEKRHLHDDDIAGIQSIYGQRPSDFDAGDIAIPDAGLNTNLDAGAAYDVPANLNDAARSDSTAPDLAAFDVQGDGDSGSASHDASARQDSGLYDVLAADQLISEPLSADAAREQQQPQTAAGCGCAAREQNTSAWLVIVLSFIGVLWRKQR